MKKQTNAIHIDNLGTGNTEKVLEKILRFYPGFHVDRVNDEVFIPLATKASFLDVLKSLNKAFTAAGFWFSYYPGQYILIDGVFIEHKKY